jgi:predicted GNAT family N-acyltransferase
LVYKEADAVEREELLTQRRIIFENDLGHMPDDGLDDAACHLIARSSDSGIVAAFRLVGPELRPFDFECAYPLADFVGSGRRPAMLGRLWVRQDYRRVERSVVLFQGLMRLALRLSDEKQFSDYFLITLDRLVKFYRAARFKDVGVVFQHHGWGPVRVMHLDIVRVRASTFQRKGEGQLPKRR